MTRLIGRAIDSSQSDPILYAIRQGATRWFEVLAPVLTENDISDEVLAAAYPLHPITALVLPLLCTRYAQNDRSLFTFLTSEEPYGLQEFMTTAQVEGEKIPTLKLYQLYDYFVESVTGLLSRINLQRWVEIQGLIEDARDRSPETIQVLKTIGILNLITTTGSLRATPQLVALALCDSPEDDELENWRKMIQELQHRSLITYRSQLQELRIWQGSDFNVEAAIYELIEQERVPIAELLSQAYPLPQVVPQRHYTTTGTLRYFEQRYGDSRLNLPELTCSSGEYDGLILYWLDRTELESVPEKTLDGKPLVVVEVAKLDVLATRAQEFQVLKKIWKTAPELQNDGVARREVKQRLTDAERLLDETVRQTFDWANSQNRCWVEGTLRHMPNARTFQSALSEVCDRTYPQTPILDNELINRRVLTSQGAKARRELIEAMLERADQPRLGLEGYGLEVAMYYSVLEAGGIHRHEDNQWGFYPPPDDAGISPLWEAIETFCLEAKEKQLSLGDLYQRLEQPPYGIKQGMVPVVVAAVLLYHVDDVGFYKDGTFVPVMGPEHFELLVKDPSRFSVKYFEMVGLRSQVFKELETVLKSPNAKAPARVRNASLLAVAKPLFGFVRQLPEFTQTTKRLSSEAQKVLKVLQTAQEPDALLFASLPNACGFNPMTTGSEENEQEAKAFRKKLVQCIHEIQTAYDNLLADCQRHLYEAFGVRTKEANLREDLRVRASYLVGQCIDPVLRHFVMKAVEEGSNDRDWLEALIRIVADKHPKGWVDGDFSRFEIALSDLVRRFENLEALRTEIRRQGKGFDALRITVTEPDGQEVHEVVWIDEEHEELLDRLAEEVLNTPALKNNIRLQKGFLAKLNEKLLSRKNVDSLDELGKPRLKRSQLA
jgi:hypothetical protein